MQIIFMGTAEIAVQAFRWLVEESEHNVVALVTQPDRPTGRRQVLTEPPLKRLAAHYKLPVLQPSRLRSEEAIRSILAYQPQLMVVMAYGQILPKKLLESPIHGCINLHASILPRHRGASPIQAAILAGDAETGITAMQMNEGMDTGDILHIERLPLRRRETASTLHNSLAALAPKALAATLDAILLNKLTPTPQDENLATYAPKLERASGRIDWRLDATALDRHVRAMQPWPGAITELHRGNHPPRNLKVVSALPNHRCTGRPGSILRLSSRGILVGCGSGSLLIRSLQMEGGKLMRADDFLRGHPLEAGRDLLV